MKCIICGKEFEGYGNNPWPVKAKGRCCDECNLNFVIPARLKMVKR
jgi:DNA-directed RNA polymerase subunit RPC12/RpoP